MKFTWNIPAECEINIQRCAEWVNEQIQKDFFWDGKYPDEMTIIGYTTNKVLDMIDGEGYVSNEVPQEVLTKICEEVLKHVCYQTIMDLGEEE